EESESAPVYKHFVPTALFLTDPEKVPEIMHHLLHAFRVLSDYAISSGGLLLLALSVSTRSLSLPVLTSLTGQDACAPGRFLSPASAGPTRIACKIYPAFDI